MSVEAATRIRPESELHWYYTVLPSGPGYKCIGNISCAQYCHSTGRERLSVSIIQISIKAISVWFRDGRQQVENAVHDQFLLA